MIPAVSEGTLDEASGALTLPSQALTAGIFSQALKALVSPTMGPDASAAEVADREQSDLENEEAAPSTSAPPSPVVKRSMTEHVLEFVSFVGKQMPLSSLLDGVPSRFSAILSAEVVSIYLLEGDGDGLVLRGNVGFTAEAQGRIRLRVGEGLTGLAVQQKEPVSVVRASRHGNFRRFAELDEDRFPIFLAMPVLGPDQRSLGAVVLQRRENPFEPHEIALAAALTAPIAYAVRQAALIDDLRDRTQRKTGGGTRKITLPGHPIVAGRAMGALSALRRPAKDRKQAPGKEDRKRVKDAFDSVERSIESFLTRVRKLSPSAAYLFEGYGLIASDRRLRERALELIDKNCGAAQALSTMAREVTRAATGIVGDPFLADRSRDIEDICDIVLMLASPDARAEAPSKAVLLGDDFTLFDLLTIERMQPSGIALTTAGSPRTHALLRLLDIPSITSVQGAFRWISPGDVVMVDADHGFFIVNPSRAEVSAYRASRKRTSIP